MGLLSEKLKEVLYSVLPITLIVFVLHFTIAPLPAMMLGQFSIGAILIILGLSVFLVGVDLGITPIGSHIGSFISKSNKIWIVVVIGLVLGFFINIAEPDLHILAGQVEAVTGGVIAKALLLVVVSTGIAVMLAGGLIRIVYNYPLNRVLVLFYGIIALLSLFVAPEFLAISFDSSGATTGALTVPFILALAIGVSSLKKDSKASEKDSFGLVGIASIGAIWGVLLMGIFSNLGDMTGSAQESAEVSTSLFGPFISDMSSHLLESFVALLPLAVIFLFFQAVAFRFHRKQVRRIMTGIVYTFIGLVFFLTGVNVGFMNVGTELGKNIAGMSHKSIVVIIGFFLGLVTILAEPAVHVLTQQIENVTSGYVKRKTVLGALSIGVGAAVALSMLRIIIPQIKLWHYLLPGYIISIALTFIVPKLFVGIAFDSGGVATGPMTATFILAFSQGTASAVSGASALTDAFGMIALVAMTPIITLQVLGLIVKLKTRKREGEAQNETL